MGNEQIGERISFRRKQLGLTLDDIASEIGVAKSTVQRYEKGTIDKVKLPVIEAIARVLQVNPSWLCGKIDGMTLRPENYADFEGSIMGNVMKTPMKYAAIITYTNGERTGATVEAASMREAWEKLMAAIPADHIQSIDLAEILTPDREIK